MKKLFVHYDIAIKLKEIGFDESCITYFEKTPFNSKWTLAGLIATTGLNTPYPYGTADLSKIGDVPDGGKGYYVFTGFKNSVKYHNHNIVTAPTYGQVIDWLAETKNAHIEPITSIDDNGKVSKKYRVFIVYPPDLNKFPGSKYSSRDFYDSDLTDALESAIKYLR